MSSIDLIRGFQTMGCKDDLKGAIASMVYVDLIEDKNISNLEQIYDSELDLIYFRGLRETFGANVIVPVSSSFDIDMNKIEDFQSKFNSEGKSITLAICDPSSTILYYNTTNDFVEK
ncbi:uncharacterized protein LOC129911362 [Episyrphus balteatus]|uniref:uncharacterized protein LOC129911362 n=1 Tax=Episyrphus balteatus TaxID=286459 RepID=UPI0024851B9B|nr:uncharacterized protein LOC129911362 [Episyrphus balteatus]